MMKSVKERVLFRVFRIGRYHAWAVLAFLILLTGFGVYYIRDIPLRSSFLDLLPRDDPLINQYRENEQYLAQSNYVAILLTVPSDLPEEERKTTLLVAAERIAELLRPALGLGSISQRLRAAGNGRRPGLHRDAARLILVAD